MGGGKLGQQNFTSPAAPTKQIFFGSFFFLLFFVQELNLVVQK